MNSLNPRELGTVLAALRFWQRLGDRHGGPELAIATDEGQLASLSDEEIDGLCERLNLGMGSHEEATPEELARARDLYAAGSDDDIEIDDGAKVSRADDGTWVQAWVWLAHDVQPAVEEPQPAQVSTSGGQALAIPAKVPISRFLETIASVLIQDLVGDYETPHQVPEWHWIRANASYGHRDNGVDGVWEFVINVARTYDDLPERLAPAIHAAREAGAGYLLVHQGT